MFKGAFKPSPILREMTNTIKLGYNDHGYNEYTVITNTLSRLVWFSKFCQWNFSFIAIIIFEIHCYNEQNSNIFYKLQAFLIDF